MEKLEAKHLLLSNKIRKTQFRIELLEIFIHSEYGLSFKDIKERVNSTQDKVTIYRGLAFFEKKGLIHKVPNTNQVSQYALCPNICSEESHIHNHAHFICNLCEKTFCIDEIDIPELKKINGYNIKKSNLTLEGDCPDCIT